MKEQTRRSCPGLSRRVGAAWGAFTGGVLEAARVARFGGPAVFGAGPGLTALLLLIGMLGGLLPLVHIRATTCLIDALDPGGGVPLPAAAMPWLGLLVGAMVLGNALDAATPLLAAHLQERVARRLKHHLYRKATALRLGAFETPEYYDRLARAGRLLERDLEGLPESVPQTVRLLVGMAGTAAVLAAIHLPLLLLLAVASGPLAVMQVRMNAEFLRINYMQSPLKRRRSYWRDLSTWRGPAAELRLFGLGPHLLARWRAANDALIAESFASRRRWTGRALAAMGLVTLLGGAVLAGIVAAGAGGEITAGALVASLYALRQFQSYRSQIGFQIEQLARYGAGLRNLMEFLEAPGEEGEDGAAAPSPRRGITFENVSFTYPGAAEPALRDVTLTLRPGERLALVGENGAGKSTFARLLLGLEMPTAGRVRAEGVDLGEIAPSAWRARAAALFQGFVQYHLTAAENIGLGDVTRGADRAAVAEAARRGGADAVVEALPAAYETLLGRGFDGAHDLSLGQWQTIALARAAMREARVPVLDEPAASLDALAEQDLDRRLRDAARGSSTVLLITHRLGAARLADRIAVLERGRVVQVGSHEELLASGGVYAELYALQAEWYGEPG